MATRTFQFSGTVTVSDDEAADPLDIRFSLPELRETLERCVILDIDEDEREIGSGIVAALALDWDVLVEMEYEGDLK